MMALVQSSFQKTVQQVLSPRSAEVDMSNAAVIFHELPATFPEKDEHKGSAAAGSLVLHLALVTGLILFPLLIPEKIENSRLVALITLAPPPPPPPPAPAPA